MSNARFKRIYCKMHDVNSFVFPTEAYQTSYNALTNAIDLNESSDQWL